MIEVDRPNRQARRRAGKSDTVDAIEAARGALSGRVAGIAKSADGTVEAMRTLVVAKRSARQARISYLNQIRHLGFTAPDELRTVRPVPRAALAATAAGLRPHAGSDPVLYADQTRDAHARSPCPGAGRRHDDLDVVLAELVAVTAPSLLEVHGVGVDTAAILLVAAGDNSERIRTEAAFAHLWGPLRPRPGQARPTDGTASTSAATVTPTTLSGGSRSPG